MSTLHFREPMLLHPLRPLALLLLAQGGGGVPAAVTADDGDAAALELLGKLLLSRGMLAPTFAPTTKAYMVHEAAGATLTLVAECVPDSSVSLP